MNTHAILLAFVLAIALPSSEPTQNRDNPHQFLVGKDTYVWTQLNGSAPYSKSYNYQLFADDQRILAFHPSGVWASTDGRNWQKTPLSNIVKNQAFLDYVSFNGYVYGLGTFEGNIERYTQTSQIARTSDFKTWEIVARDSNLPKRFFYHPFVFQNKLWIIGGGNGTSQFDDAWVSSDAVHWTKVADNLPFGKRSGNRFVVFKDKLYMLDHDAWVSPDGIRWTLLTAQIAEDIFGYSVEVFHDKIWLIGCSRSGRFQSEVLYSTDGITWIPERAPWSPRGAAATCVFKDQIIMTGGKYGGAGIAGQTEFVYSNDVWSLKRQ